MGFIIILIITTLALAGSAAFFSIYGLAAIFSGIFWPVVLMGTSLEAGKLVAASYVYRFRDSITKIMKAYLISAILILMLITSAGIFGFLSMGYQQDSLPLKQQEQQIELLVSEKAELETFKKERLTRRKQIDSDIAALPNNYVTGRQRLLKSYKPELDSLRADIELYTKQISNKTLKISELKQQKLISEVHTGPIIFIAQAFGAETDGATKWMIILIMFAFDPLAVALTLAVNHAILERKKKLGHIEPGLEIVERFISDDDLSEVNLNDVKPTANIGIDELKEAIKAMQDINVTPAANVDIDELKDAIKSMQDININPTANIGIDELKEAIKSMQGEELSISDLAQKGMLEEMLQRKMVTEKIRNPDKK